MVAPVGAVGILALVLAPFILSIAVPLRLSLGGHVFSAKFAHDLTWDEALSIRDGAHKTDFLFGGSGITFRVGESAYILAVDYPRD